MPIGNEARAATDARIYRRIVASWMAFSCSSVSSNCLAGLRSNALADYLATRNCGHASRERLYGPHHQ